MSSVRRYPNLAAVVYGEGNDFRSPVDNAAGKSVASLAIADFLKDSLPDVATIDSVARKVTILQNNS